MQRRTLFAASLFLPVCVMSDEPAEDEQPIEQQLTRFILDPQNPEQSYGQLPNGEKFSVGLGRKGVTPAGQTFEPGCSLLGSFKVNAVLSVDRFEMTDQLIQQSGKSREWLADNLFQNMSSIDFDGDGQGSEYGRSFIGLSPLASNAPQPFRFNKYKGTFRWYSYAIHGTQDESRIGKCVTGGCINVGKSDLQKLLQFVKLGDEILVTLPSK